MQNSLGVIFDVDGVLVDSYKAHFASWQKLALEQNRSITESQFAATFGRTSREIIAQQWSDAGLTDRQIDELDDRKEAHYREIMRDRFPTMPGAAELVEALADAGFRLAVGSSGPPENVQLVVDHVDPNRRIEAIVTGKDVTRGKPDPQVFQLGAERLGIPPGRCAVIEDASAGIAGAHAAGMRGIALVSTGRTRNELAEGDLIIDSLLELTPTTVRELILRGSQV